MTTNKKTLTRRRKSTPARRLWNLIGAPLRMIVLPDAASNRLGLASLEDERMAAVLPWVRGRLLDVGAGNNRLVREYGTGVGVDRFDLGHGTLAIESSARLPFLDASFDTVTFVASLNHIPERSAALLEAARLLRPDGRLLITMIDPILSSIGHRIWWYDEHHHRGGMAPGEVFGFWPREIRELVSAAGFQMEREVRFLYGLNRLYVARKPRDLPTQPSLEDR